MRKALFTNFRFLFLLILFLHLSVLYLQLHKKFNEVPPSTALKVKILRDPFLTKQIVESEDPLEKTTPKDKAYLSDKNRAFDRETRARVIEHFQKSTPARGKVKDLSLADLGGELGKKNPLEKAAKNYGKVDRGVSSTSDYLADVPVGDLTHLNTVEYKFYGYYYRIKQRLEGFWGRSVQEKAAMLASQGRHLMEDEHITALRIVMSAAGEIIDVVILGSSGVKELDDAAIESFNEAGPFPNPPKDLIVGDRVTIEWGFVVKS